METMEKKGMATGFTVSHPVSGEEIPVWVAKSHSLSAKYSPKVGAGSLQTCSFSRTMTGAPKKNTSKQTSQPKDDAKPSRRKPQAQKKRPQQNQPTKQPGKRPPTAAPDPKARTPPLLWKAPWLM